jgi:transposase InsO family protein
MFALSNRHSRRPTKISKNSHYTAETIVEIEDRHGELVPIRCLLDTGTTSTLILRDFVKKGRAKSHKGKRTKWSTLGGSFSTNRKALLEFKFPELTTSKSVTWICHVDDKTSQKQSQYDMIIGMDLMTEIGIMVDTQDKCVKWETYATPLKQRGELHSTESVQMLYHMTQEVEVLQQAENRHSRIIDSDYSATDLNEFCKELAHLSLEEQQMLKRTLSKHESMFQGGLGKLDIKPVHLELKPGIKPFHSRAFPVPKSLEVPTKKEIKRLEKIKVFKKSHDSEWAAPTFIQKKKTGDPRILTDFRKLNDAITRKPFPLPKIADLLQKLSGFRYATAIDLSMGYYHIPLDEESSKLCTTILPWGKYQYLRLPMGIKNSPDIFQSIMMDLLGDIEYARTYLDDILITSDGSFQDHMNKLDTVLARLRAAGFRANVRKCYFAEDSLEYLGYQLTRDGIQPQPKKVEAILRIAPPKTKRQLRHFLGMVNFYRDVWRRRSHTLAPLTGLVSKEAKWIWGKAQQDAFDEMKRIMSKETLLTFPDFNKEFHIYTDASDYQLGAVIMQDGKPLAFYSRKLSATQRNYTTGEQELLSIVETLKEFNNILLGQKLIVHTDHKNIVYGNLSNPRIVRWRLLLEEYGPEYRHIAGKDNVVADALSRMEANFDKNINENRDAPLVCAAAVTCLIRDESVMIPDPLDKEEMAEAFASIARNSEEEETFPLSPTLLATEQRKDKTLMRNVKRASNIYSTRTIEDVELITYHDKIVVPLTLRSRIIAWYHQYLQHPGMTRMEKTLRQTLTWPNLSKDVEKYVGSCHKCQLCKKLMKKYGKLPEKEAEPPIPWNRVNIDMIGPLSVKTPSGTHELRALTMIDPATGWFEVKDLPNASAAACEAAFDDVWLSRYPRPQYLGYDNGSEYKKSFETLRKNYSLKKKRSLEYNPQSNGIIERVHQVLNDILRTFELEEMELNNDDPWSEFLSAAAFAIRSTYHTTLEATPAQLVFGRDMYLPIKIEADWNRIQQRRQAEMHRNNQRENRSRINHVYRVGDKVLLARPGILRKLSTPRQGPYNVEQVNTNGTIRIRKGAVSDTVNIRRVTPYREPNDTP